MSEGNNLSPIFVIILNWNLAEETIVCVQSVQHAIHAASQPARILIVDNGSKDDSVSRFQSAFGESVAIIETGHNLGFAGGMNAGMRQALEAGAGSILLLNNDTVVDEEMIRILFRAAIQSKGRSIVSPFIYYFDAPQTVWKIGDRETCWLPIPLNIDAEAVTLKEEEPFTVDYVTGCCMLVPRLVLQQVGLFDERFFMYFEDADFCRRVRNAGFQLSVVPQAKMWHKVSLSAKKDRPGQRYWRTWGRVQFYLQHSHGMFPLLKHVYLWLLALYTTVIDVLEGDRNLVLPLWAGMLDGYEHKNRRQKRYFRT